MDREWLSLGDEWFAGARYCLRCGDSLQILERFGAERPTCGACGFILFRTPATGVAAIVLRGSQVLLVERGIAPYRGHWGFPAGYQEYGETPAETAVRETREETGLEIEVGEVFDVLYTTDDPRKDANLVVFLARSVAGEPLGADDATDARFFPIDSLPAQIAFDNNRILLERLQRAHANRELP